MPNLYINDIARHTGRKQLDTLIMHDVLSEKTVHIYQQWRKNKRKKIEESQVSGLIGSQNNEISGNRT